MQSIDVEYAQWVTFDQINKDVYNTINNIVSIHMINDTYDAIRSLLLMMVCDKHKTRIRKPWSIFYNISIHDEFITYTHSRLHAILHNIKLTNTIIDIIINHINERIACGVPKRNSRDRISVINNVVTYGGFQTTMYGNVVCKMCRYVRISHVVSMIIRYSILGMSSNHQYIPNSIYTTLRKKHNVLLNVYSTPLLQRCGYKYCSLFDDDKIFNSIGTPLNIEQMEVNNMIIYPPQIAPIILNTYKYIDAVINKSYDMGVNLFILFIVRYSEYPQTYNIIRWSKHKHVEIIFPKYNHVYMMNNTHVLSNTDTSFFIFDGGYDGDPYKYMDIVLHMCKSNKTHVKNIPNDMMLPLSGNQHNGKYTLRDMYDRENIIDVCISKRMSKCQLSLSSYPHNDNTYVVKY